MTIRKKPIRKLFIANRGEICRRIASTAKRMGIKTACVTTGAPPPRFLVGLIDTFVPVDKENVALYLNADRMLALAKQAGADALHPGFGFLSENESFARLVEEEIVWVGPPPSAMEAMGHKSEARKIAERLKIPSIQGASVPENVDEQSLRKLAEKVGYPLLLKAAKGGGGKGMRVVHVPQDLWTEAQRAFSEASSYFGDGTLLIERYLEKARHVEVQILGDQHGNLITLGDRDCSVQRRYQKIIEEAPAPALTEKTREALAQQAVRLAREVGYYSCGTVEFLLDWSERSRTAELQSFYFLEMNTRLQVEHPVTEAVLGLDLVEWQLRVAMGEALPNKMQTYRTQGHAVEARVYAEDPGRNFFPSPGAVAHFEPCHITGVRWDVGIDSVDEITPEFDPMIGKVIAWGENRHAAIERLKDSLERTFLAGPPNNVEYLVELLGSPAFQSGPVDTQFLVHHHETLLEDLRKKREEQALVAQEVFEVLEQEKGTFGKHAHHDRLSVPDLSTMIFGQNSKVESFHPSHPIQLIYENRKQTMSRPPLVIFDGQLLWGVGEKQRLVSYTSVKEGSTRHLFVKVGGHHFVRHQAVQNTQKRGANTQAQTHVVAPVPGKVVRINVRAGEVVQAHQSLFVLDSMKMEFNVTSLGTGTLKEVMVKEGEQVASGQVLAEMQS
ncbi:MAG: biotin/lipoyl-binding protein [Deltaproteobacteria bacterium]|nr:biotin/lipoyl-binding protein [Deltaproteobacteria bacterium]